MGELDKPANRPQRHLVAAGELPAALVAHADLLALGDKRHAGGRRAHVEPIPLTAQAAGRGLAGDEPDHKIVRAVRGDWQLNGGRATLLLVVQHGEHLSSAGVSATSAASWR